MLLIARRLPGGAHYAWLVVGIVFVTLLASAGVRATPSVLIVPLEQAFGWSRATISFAISINLMLFGLLGPFAAALMQRIGIRRTVLGALVLLDLAVFASSFMTESWQLVLTWGLSVGCCAGALSVAFGASVVNRWFTTRRGLAMGIVTAANAAGQLIFLPLLAWIAENDGWRPTVWLAAGTVAAIIPFVFFLLPEGPRAVGVLPYGDTVEKPAASGPMVNPITTALSALGRASKSGSFWLIFGSFFVCGASANGLVGTHLISYCFDNGIPEVRAAGLLAGMAVFNIIGTTLSGWLSDRYDCRKLLMMYYGLRGISLLCLPFTDFSFATLSIFALFYGLDWIATAPPTLRLITDVFGRTDTPVIYGWTFAGHQLGAATVAFVAGALRGNFGSYLIPFLLSGMLCLAASVFVLWIGRARRGTGPGLLEPVAAAQ
jgi:MFS family permease